MSNLKIEDLHLDLPTQPVDEKNWDLEKWRNENPMDYFKAMYILGMANHHILKAEIFQTIYKIIRLYIPDNHNCKRSTNMVYSYHRRDTI